MRGIIPYIFDYWADFFLLNGYVILGQMQFVILYKMTPLCLVRPKIDFHVIIGSIQRKIKRICFKKIDRNKNEA